MGPRRDVQVGELIGRPCVAADGAELGEIIYVERDLDGRPAFFDVRFCDAFMAEHGWSFTRVRMSAAWIDGWDADAAAGAVALGLPVETLCTRWYPVRSEPVRPEPVREPTF